MGVGAEVDPVGRRAGWRATMWLVPRTGLPIRPEPDRTELCKELLELARKVGKEKTKSGRSLSHWGQKDWLQSG